MQSQVKYFVVPRPVASAKLGHMLEMQIIGHRPTALDLLEVGPRHVHCDSPARGLECRLRVKNHCPGGKEGRELTCQVL